MNQENWQKVKEVFYSALNRPESDRPAYLDDVCSGDPTFRSEVEMLLHSYESGYLEDSIWPDKIGDKEPVPPFFADGHEFSHYRIIKMIGRGGMGEVYLATDETLDRPVAIKVVSDSFGFGDMAAKRLLREARSAARLDHPNICSVYEVGETDGRPFIAMQYVDGETLDARIKRGPIPFDECVLITRKIAAALAEAHARGIVHRDIKPANVIIDARGQLKVLDFGLAKRSLLADGTNESQLSEVGVIAGTAAFMSPEQARGQQIDPRTDIWSLGIVFYQLLTGKMPFSGRSNADIVAAILHTEFRPPSELAEGLPEFAGFIVKKALQKDRDDRYGTVEELDADLSAFSNSDPTFSLSGIIGTRSSNRSRSKHQRNIRLSVVAVLLVLVCAGAFGGWLVYNDNRASQQSFSNLAKGNLQISKLYSAKRLSNGGVSDISFSPDGKLIAFLTAGGGKGAIYVKQVKGGDSFKVTDGKSNDVTPVWSSDGQRIAFVSDRNGQMGVWAVSYLGGTPELLTSLTGETWEYKLRKWSADGSKIYFESRPNLKILDVASGSISDIPLEGVQGKVEGEFSISADETMLVFVSEENDKQQLWVQPIKGGKARRVSLTDHHSWSPAWFPDNKRIAFSSEQTGNFQIYVTGISGGDASQITFGDFNASYPVISPDGNQIIYVSETDEANIYEFDLESRVETVQTSNVKMQLFPNVSPDGKQFLFQSTEDSDKLENSPLRIKSIGVEQELSDLNRDGAFGKWAPDMRSVVYVRRAGTTDTNLWSLDLMTRVERRLTKVGVVVEGYNTTPFELLSSPFDWASDGSKIAFCSTDATGQNNIWMAAADGSGETMLTSYSDRNIRVASPVWSRNGERLAYRETVKSETGDQPTKYRIAILDASGIKRLFETTEGISILGWDASDSMLYISEGIKNITKILSIQTGGNKAPDEIAIVNGSRFNWVKISPDRRSIAYLVDHNSVENIFWRPLGGGQPIQVTTNDEPTLFFSGLVWAPGSKKLYYSKQTGGVQISLISNIKKE